MMTNSIDFKNIKLWAFILLILMIVIMSMIHIFFTESDIHASYCLSLLEEGARAGLVGGLADWFAVTALFRHPLGIKIPHTAILLRKKKKLGEALGDFVAHYFLKEEDIGRLFYKGDLARFLLKSMKSPENSKQILKILRRILPETLEGIHDGRMGGLLRRCIPVILNGEEANLLVVRGMKAMMKSDIHQEVFSCFLEQFKQLIISKEPELRHFVKMRVREQGGRLVGWAIGASVAHQVLNALKIELERVDPMDSRLRKGFSHWMNEKILYLEERPEEISLLTSKITQFLGDDTLCEWFAELWQRVRLQVEEDSQKEDGWSAQTFGTLVAYLFDFLEGHDEYLNKFNEISFVNIIKILPFLRQETASFICNIIERWDGKSLSERLENGLGRDLAFIRINGTVVGFLVGVFLEMVIIFFNIL